MESNYYIPQPSDMHIGYECEAHWCCPKHWLKVTITETDSEIYGEVPIAYLPNYNYRTPYLTREQIIAEGWSDKGEYFFLGYQDVEFYAEFTSGPLDFIAPSLKIYRNFFPHSSKRDLVFWGKCPSINEFRKICKLIGI